jgi:hypothetical protein
MTTFYWISWNTKPKNSKNTILFRLCLYLSIFVQVCSYFFFLFSFFFFSFLRCDFWTFIGTFQFLFKNHLGTFVKVYLRKVSFIVIFQEKFKKELTLSIKTSSSGGNTFLFEWSTKKFIIFLCSIRISNISFPQINNCLENQ